MPNTKSKRKAGEFAACDFGILIVIYSPGTTVVIHRMLRGSRHIKNGFVDFVLFVAFVRTDLPVREALMS